jgi:large subunit ribosomal protein L30
VARKIEIRQVRSAIGRHWRQKRTLQALGVRRMHRPVVHEDTPQIRGMVKKVIHLLQVRELPEE